MLMGLGYESKKIKDSHSPKGINSEETLASYLKQVRGFPLFSAEENLKTFQQWQEKRTNQYRNILIQHNLGLVVMVARQYLTRKNSFLDLIQEGNLGLLRAIEKFDPERKVPFGSYALFWIKAYILKFIQMNASLLTVGSGKSFRKAFWNLSKAQAQLEAEGREISAEGLAVQLEVSPRVVADVQASLGEVPFEEGAELALACTRPGPEALYVASEELRNREDRLKNVRARAGKKSPLWEYVFDHRLLNPTKTCQEIAVEKSITRQRVSQIEQQLKSWIGA